MADILEIQDLVVSYGGIEAVKGISLHVEQGKIVTLIGSNGAGKSTTLKTIAGLVKAKAGAIRLEGQDILGKSTDEIVSRGVTLVPEGRRVFPNLTVEENLRIGAYLRKDNIRPDLDRVYELFPRLHERAWQLAGTLSGGEQQMLAVGRALMQGNLVNCIRDNIDFIGHFHSAGVPGRHELQNGEINYPFVIEAAEKAGYDRYFGFEYWPTCDNEQSLRDILRYVRG